MTAVELKLKRALAGIVDDGNVTLPVAMRQIALTVEAAQHILRILESQDYPTHCGREMPTGRASTA